MFRLWLTKIIGWSANLHGGWLTHVVIALFIWFYEVDMQEAQQPKISSYDTFNEFFTRSLRSEIRPIDNDPNVLVMPADGIISQLGYIEKESFFQAKKHHYVLNELLAHNESMISSVFDGSFIIIYLSPKDYHRVHIPCDATLREVLHVPGTLFSVHPSAVNISEKLTHNERLICLFDTNFGKMIQILIGAIVVGSIETVWCGTIIPHRYSTIQSWYYPEANHPYAIKFIKGQEIGRFKLGSTVISLFPKIVLLNDTLSTHQIARVGLPFSRIIPGI